MKLQSVKQRFGIVGNSPKLNRALDTAIRVAPVDVTVLITGESGVGKEVFSQIIHALSPRKHEKFIAVNCGAIPEGTINSELFGHEKGAFTGAVGERKGYFETYNGGVIFLDEIAEMPLETQSYLLRVLENGEFIRVGSSKPLRTDIRVIAATNVNLKERIKAGKFREDLYFRLNTVPISVPPLRERREDIYLLFRRFAVDFAEKYRTTPIQLDERARLLIENYSWPGNIRELKNVAEQLSVLSQEKIIAAEDLIDFMPQIMQRNLPAVSPRVSGSNLEEREILYKLLFEMKKDLNDLKSLVVELARTNDLQMPQGGYQKMVPGVSAAPAFPHSDSGYDDLIFDKRSPVQEDYDAGSKPIILDQKSVAQYNEMEEVEEILSLQANEKELIRKALKKHNGRRKEAAEELEISERTLYRKIKEYDL